MKQLAILSILFLCSLAGAQAMKCQNKNGTVTYSDVSCGSDGKYIDTSPNTLDTSAIRKDIVNDNLKQAESQAAASAKCKFSSITSRGKALAAEAKEECIRNAGSKIQGKPAESTARDAWMDQNSSDSQRRESRLTRDAINQQGMQTRNEITNQGDRLKNELNRPVTCNQFGSRISCN